MHRATISAGLAAGCLAAGAVGFAGVATAGAPADGHIAGRVLVCNVPNHCMTREFAVSAVDSAGRTVAKTTTHSAHNEYRLEVPPGHYKLVAKSSGLVCRASASAVAHRTTRRNITCLVP
jgi:hypothetical protein